MNGVISGFRDTCSRQYGKYSVFCRILYCLFVLSLVGQRLDGIVRSRLYRFGRKVQFKKYKIEKIIYNQLFCYSYFIELRQVVCLLLGKDYYVFLQWQNILVQLVEVYSFQGEGEVLEEEMERVQFGLLGFFFQVIEDEWQ